MLNIDEEYDAIIDINSIKKLDKGWEIKYNGNSNKIKETKNIINSSDKRFISILGHANRGKTYILQKICDVKLHSGYEITTKGISLKIFGENVILLDTVGTNAPLLLENDGSEDPRGKINFQKELDDINLCQIITNYIVQTFVINHADTLICVVGMLTNSEQQFLNKIKKNCSGKKQLIVIHNLIQCYEIKEIEDYIENTLKKSIIHNLKDMKIPGFDDNEGNNFNRYFVEEDNGEDHQFDILHFIMANDFERNNNQRQNEQIRYFNAPTIDFIRNNITQHINKDINILEKLIEHIKYISSQVLENELKEIKIIDSNNNQLIKCEEKIIPKEVTADELDNIYFVGKEYEPPFRYYRNEKQFIIEIKICSKIKNDTLKIEQKFIESSGEFEFNITGERSLEVVTNFLKEKLFIHY